MKKKYISIALFIGTISSLSYLVFIFLWNYNSPENIEERCKVKFHRDVKKGVDKPDEEWGLNIDKASNNYFKCLKIP